MDLEHPRQASRSHLFILQQRLLATLPSFPKDLSEVQAVSPGFGKVSLKSP